MHICDKVKKETSLVLHALHAYVYIVSVKLHYQVPHVMHVIFRCVLLLQDRIFSFDYLSFFCFVGLSYMQYSKGYVKKGLISLQSLLLIFLRDVKRFCTQNKSQSDIIFRNS